MQKIKFFILSFCVLLCGSNSYAQPNSCLVAETVLDSLDKFYAQDFYNMVCYSDSSSLTFHPEQLSGRHLALYDDKRILNAKSIEEFNPLACEYTKVTMRTGNPDSITNNKAVFGRSKNYTNDVGIRFSNLLYSSEVIIGYMQLNMHKDHLFYYFLFEKNKQTGDWEIKKLAQLANA